MNCDTFQALGFVLLPDGTIYFFGKALDLITKEEAFDPYLWQRCNHEESLRKLIRRKEVDISDDISYIPTYYGILKQLVQEHHIVFLNRTKRSIVKSATIFTNPVITNLQYEVLMRYHNLCNCCDHMTVSYLQCEKLYEQNNVSDLEQFIEEYITVENVNCKKK